MIQSGQSLSLPEKSRLNPHNFVILILLLIFPIHLSAQTLRFNTSRQKPVIQTAGNLWIGTESGLFQYNIDNESVRRYELKDMIFPVRDLKMNDEWLWCAGDSGLWAIQTRLNDKLFFNSASGLPSSIVNGIAFSGDYVWAATPAGAARFDASIEQWELMDARRGLNFSDISDVTASNDLIWLLSGNTLVEYDQKYEKQRSYLLDTSLAKPSRLLMLDDEIWIKGADGLLRFQIQSKRQTIFREEFLNSENLVDIFYETGKLWALSRAGLFLYEQQSGTWKEFEGNNGFEGLNVTQGDISPSKIWLLANDILHIWDRSSKTWSTLDYSSGLPRNNYSNIVVFSDLALLFTKDALCIRGSAASPWKEYSAGGKPKLSTGEVLKNLFDNEKGGSVEYGSYKLGLEGTRINLYRDYSRRVSDPSAPWQNTSSDKLDLKSQLDLLNGRRVSGFYNNTDYSETMYGVRYRGNDSDIVREFTWGDYSLNQGNSPFAQNAQLFGSSIWLQYGSKTPQFKRSMITLKAGTAELRSKKTYESYSGSVTKYGNYADPNSYIHNQFFALPGAVNEKSPTELRIYYDDGNNVNNTPNTLDNNVIAGMRGYFDMLVPAEDFCFYGKAGLLRITKALNRKWKIAAVYQIDGIRRELVLQDGAGNSQAKKNVYPLRGSGIIPYSFELKIESAVAKIPLNSLGIDNNNDGRVDDDRIDYENGLLFFPAEYPFPLDPESINPDFPYVRNVIMQTRFETKESMIRLKWQNLVRGSEKLYIDDVPAEAGNDYIIDYTNGTVVFVRDGLINRDTRIEIEYEYYRAENTDIYAASLNISPSDAFYSQADWEKTSDSKINNVSVFSEARYKTGGYDIKITPGAVFDLNDSRFSAGSFEAAVSSERFRLLSNFNTYDSSYSSLYRPNSMTGPVRIKGRLAASYDALEFLRLSGGGYLLLNSLEDQRSNSASFTADLHHKEYPSTQITLSRSGQYANDKVRRTFLLGSVDYSTPVLFNQSLSIKSLRLEHSEKYGTYSSDLNQDEFNYRIWNRFYRVTSQFTDQTQAGLSYRDNRVDDAARDYTSVASSERLIGDFTFNEFRAAQLLFALENNLDQDFHSASDRSDYYLRRFCQAVLRLSPGIWSRQLAPLYFELGFNQSLNQSGESENHAGKMLWGFSQPSEEAVNSKLLVRNYSFKNELRYSADLLITSILEYNTQDISVSTTEMRKHIFRWSEKADCKVSFQTRLVPQYKYSRQNSGFFRTQTINEPSLWIEHRWSPEILQMTSFLYRQTDEYERALSSRTRDYEGSFDLILQKKQFMLMRYVELRQSFLLSYHNGSGYSPIKTMQYSSITSLDLFPLHSLIIRLRMDYSAFENRLVTFADYSILQFNLKATLQF